MLGFVLCGALLFGALSEPSRQAPRATTSLGVLEGDWKVLGGRAAFLGIPYAEPPVGQLRFRRAVPKSPWAGVRDATSCGSPCLQGGGSIGSEDCLFANVWSPDLEPAVLLPVLVFIHGGSLTTGSGSCDGAIVEDGLVQATLNYRLGQFGFFQHEDLREEDPDWPSYGGMNGMADQLLALKWLQRDVGTFGGDATKVTIWGESAGAESVCNHITSLLSAGLFVRSIIESGQCVDHPGPASIQQGFDAGRSLMTTLNVSSIAELRQLSAVELAAPDMGAEYNGTMSYALDGWMQINYPSNTFRAGKLNGKDLMIGVNTADGIMRVLVAASGATFGPDMSLNDILVSAYFGFYITGSYFVDDILRQYPPRFGRFNRTDSALIGAWRDQVVACPSAQIARWAAAADMSVYVYWWGTPSGATEQYGPPHALPHGLEMPIFGDAPDPVLWDLATSKSVRQYWASFALSGVPEDTSQGVVWPQFDATAAAEDAPFSRYMYFGNGAPAVNGAPLGTDLTLSIKSDCDFWARHTNQPPTDKLVMV